MSQIKKIISSPLFNLLFISLLTFLVVRTILSANPEIVLENIKNMNLTIFLISILLAILSICLGGVALKIYTSFFTKKMSLIDCVDTSFIGTMGSGITPLGMGSQIFQFYVFNKRQVTKSHIASILWIDFFIYQIAMTITTLSLIVWKLPQFIHVSNWFWLIILGFIVNSFVVVLLFLVATSRKFHHFVTNCLVNMLVKVKLVKNKEQFNENIENQLVMFNESVALLLSHKKWLAIGLLIAVGRLIIGYSIPFVLAKAFDANMALNYFDIISLSAFYFTLNSLVPIPGQVGGAEYIFNFLFSSIYGIFTLPVLLIYRFVSYYINLILGALLFIKVKLAK